MAIDRISKWRLILGKTAEQSQDDNNSHIALSNENTEIDAALNALYDSERSGGLGSSSPNINRWLGDIRKYFPASIVQIMQKDAIERLNIQQLLLEPEMLEAVTPDIHLVGTLLSLNKLIPEKTKETARIVVQKVVHELEKKLTNPMVQAIKGSLSRAIVNRRPKYNEIDWNKTIRKNLKHYQHDYHTIIPQHLVGYGRKGQSLRDIILCVDQSGSMASSVIYSSVFGAVMASIRAVTTHMIVFDTAVVDLTADLDDPVDLLFGTQLGGGTDINKALAYCEGLIRRPTDTILILISDLYEGGNQQEMLKRVAHIKASGVHIIALLALNDEGAPYYDKQVASHFAEMDIPAFACSPDQFPDLMAAAIKRENLVAWMNRTNIVEK